MPLAAAFPAARVTGIDPFFWRVEDHDEAGRAIRDDLNELTERRPLACGLKSMRRRIGSNTSGT